GPKIPFSKTKEIAIETFELMKDLNLNPQIKFSGSRGFQIWSLIESFEIPKWYKPLPLKTEKRERNYFTLFSDFVRVIQREVGKKFPNLTTSSPKEKKKREDKILLDPSSMKRMGLVRAPYSIHSKTGLVSLPLNLKEVKNFNMENANIENVAKRFKRKGNEFNLKESNPQDLLELLRRYRG
ncbi:MAG: hypothetical protein J7L39_02090, partial [Candidatus Aenigmarchaeota archaeon]|nr:hypothetical protein [Candidatus Aenigmarchaeota archaeon]